MFEIIVAIIVVVCIIYIFKGEFTGRNAGVTVLESLPLSIFKKWVKEEKSVKEESNIKEEVINESDDIKNDSDKSNTDKVLKEIAIDILDNELEEVECTEEIGSINEIEEKLIEDVNNSIESICDSLNYNIEENIENKDIIEISNESVKEDIVYWTPKGKTYHVKNTCRTLARSKVINSGAIHESGKDFKCENCK